jgi:hypothetical protein
VGVTAPDYRDVGNFRRPDITIPLEIGMTLDNVPTQARGRYPLEAGAVLKPSFTIQQAQAELQAAWDQLTRETLPVGRKLAEWQQQTGKAVRVWPGAHGRNWLPKDLNPTILRVFAMAGILLLNVCANVGGLILARGIMQRKEIAIRLALGARYANLIRLASTEAAILSAATVGGDLLVTHWGAKLGAALLPYRNLDYGVQINHRVALLAMILSSGALVGATFLPTLQLSNLLISDILRSGDRSISTRGRFRKGLLTFQVALR